MSWAYEMREEQASRNYVQRGRIDDAYDGRSPIWACLTCRALVADEDTLPHYEWHEGRGEIPG